MKSIFYKLLLLVSLFFILYICYNAYLLPKQTWSQEHLYPFGFKLQQVQQFEASLPTLFNEQLNIILFVLSFFYMFLAALLGCYVLSYFGFIESKLISLHTYPAGFFIGYILLVAFNRLVTRLISNIYSPAIILTALLTLSLLICTELKLYRLRNFIGLIKGLCVFTFITCILLVWNIQHGRSHCTADATSSAFKLIYKTINYGPSSDENFPIITQHYDEPMFLYPLVYIQKNILPTQILSYYWLLSSVSMLAIISLLYSIIYYFTANLLISLGITGLCFIGGIGLYPTSDKELFDSWSPLMYCMHTARLLSAIIPLIFFTIYYKCKHESIKLYKRIYKRNILEMLIIFLIGLGLSGLSAHIFVYLIFFLITAALGFINFNKYNLTMYFLYSLILLFLPLIVYNRLINMRIAGVIVLVTILIVGLLLSIHNILQNIRFNNGYNKISIKFSQLFNICNIVCFVTGGFLGLFFLGNLFYKIEGFAVITRLTMPSGWGVGRIDSTLNPVFISASSPFYFYAFYGLPIVLFFIASSCLHFSNSEKSQDRTIEVILYNFTFYTALLYLVAIFSFHFTGSNNKEWEIWVRTRLLEGPFYTLIVLSCIVIYKLANSFFKHALSFAIIIWWIIPLFLYTSESKLSQFIINTKWLINNWRFN